MKNSLIAFGLVLALLAGIYVYKSNQDSRVTQPPAKEEDQGIAEEEHDGESVAAVGKRIEEVEEKGKESPQTQSKPVAQETLFLPEMKQPEYGLVKLVAQQVTPGRYVKPTLDTDYWNNKYAGEPLNARKWASAWHKGMYGSWFNGNDEKVAKGYITTWGPLGIRTYMHDQAWSHEKAFLARAPEILKDTSGMLFANAFEVIDVLPGSPAEGHLKTGDLLLAMQGQSFKSAQKLDFNYHHQNRRSLALHAGMLLDKAEAVGRVEFKLLRNAKLSKQPSGDWKLVSEVKFRHHGNKPAHHFEEKVKGGFVLRLQATDGGNGNGSDGFTWENVYLKGAVNGQRKVIPLHDLEVERTSVGYGRLTVDKETSSWEAHAHSEIDFVVPKGEWVLVADAKPRGSATVDARILARKKPRIPSALFRQVKTVKFPIDKMGSFQKGLPGGCVKTANIIAQQGAWLATQQMPDGSWQRPHGYTSNHYDTAWAGLGLMATGDPAYDSHIRKAAEFLAYKAKPDGWAVPSSCVVIFLSEYWLRYRDDKVLPALQVWLDCITTESLTGDYTVGHGHNPGYRGSGVSTGGSHTAAALAVASKTPVSVEKGILDRMLYRVQELAPDGHVPYGRGRGHTEFKPAIKHAATYSGRHGPYLVASLLHGGPKLFTENCTAMYRNGLKGGSDQGHATETLSNQWAFVAMAASDLKAYREHLDAMRWKITMRRCYNGGFCQSAFRLEYAGGESLLDYALRSGSWLVSLCAEKQNLAITGAKQYRSKHLVDLPPTQHVDAMLHGYYSRNWGVVDAVLGKQSPSRLKDALKSLLQMNRGEGLSERLTKFLKDHSLVIARDITGMKHLESRQRAYLVELLLGVDHRIDALENKDTPEANDYKVTITSQYPMAGAGLGAEALKQLGMHLQGSVTITQDPRWEVVPDTISLDSSGKVNWKNWHTGSSSSILTLKSDANVSGAFEATVKFDYKIGDLPIQYTRVILFNQGEDWGNGEKQRKVVNDRRVWVPGVLHQDHARWNISFRLPSGQFIAAASQGNDVMVRDSRGDWVSPRDHAIQKGSVGEFCYTSGWQRYECRVPEFRLKSEQALVGVQGLTRNNGKPLTDTDNILSGKNGSVSLDEVDALQVTLDEAATVRAIDFRADRVSGIVVEARVGDVWQTIHLGRPGNLVKQLKPVKTKELRINLQGAKKGASLKLLRIYRAES